MFNQMLKWTALITLWKKFKQHILATALLLILLIVISMVHSDYLSYANVAAERDIAGSFFIKWGLNLALVVSYIVIIVNLNIQKIVIFYVVNISIIYWV